MVERYAKEQGIFRSAGMADPEFSDMLELDMGSVQPSLAGPKRPQDRILLSDMKDTFQDTLKAPIAERGFELAGDALKRTVPVADNGNSYEIGHGSVVIAAITSCTNTSNPSVMLAAGLLAKKAVERGLSVAGYVKTSLAPGSRVVTNYLQEAGLLSYLEQLGFYTVGYGCTTCIGNSGPLPEPVAEAIQQGDLVTSSVLSGNRNFEGRIHSMVKASYLASPPLVVAYALAGTTDINLAEDSLGTDNDGQPVYLQDIWPTQQEVSDEVAASVQPQQYQERYANVFDGNETWNNIKSIDDLVYPWDDESTYIQEPPFFVGIGLEPDSIEEIHEARVLVLLGDSVTTDHISPAGAIAKASPAGEYLVNKGIERKDFNSYGSRRGNDRVLTRGTFANVRLRNLLAPGSEGGVTLYLPDNEQMTIFEAAERYKADGTPLVVLGGKEYGSGSSRDWAAKGALLLGIRAVIAESYERIHRSNLIGMGVLPLQFKDGDSINSLGLTGHEVFHFEGLNDDMQPNQEISVRAVREDGTEKTFTTITRIDTPVEVNYYRNGGILHTVLRNMLRDGAN